MKTTEKHFPVVLFNYAVKGGSIFFNSVDEILKYDHLNEGH